MWAGLGCWWFLVLGVSVMQTVFSWDSFLTSIWHHLNGRNVIIILAPSLTSQCLTLNKTDVHQDSTRPYYTSELFLALISHYLHLNNKEFRLDSEHSRELISAVTHLYSMASQPDLELLLITIWTEPSGRITEGGDEHTSAALAHLWWGKPC